jgi:tRNA threonylcarbamoyladenosine biosynthesis protein TsaE
MPILDHNSIEYISQTPEQTRRAGMRLGSLLIPGDVICLVGELGAGKTTLAQGIASGWGSLDQVTSPTFVLVNVYRRLDGERLFHLDAYRISDAVEAITLDIDAMIDSGPLVVEWADRIQQALPEKHLSINFQWIDAEQRDMMIKAHGQRYQELLNDFRRHVYGVV